MALLRDLIYFGFLVIGVSKANVLPVDKCKLDDSICMKTQMQKALPIFMGGIPEIGVQVLDVMDMNEVKFDLSGLQFTLTEGKLEGLKTTVIDDVKWDLGKKQIIIDCHLDGKINGHYTAAGRILALPITGDGKFTMNFKNNQIKFMVDYDLVKDSDGKHHVKLTKLNFEFEVKDDAHFHLTNLFNGNEELSDPLLKVINENWKQISTEFGQPLMEVATTKLFKNVKTYFDKQAIEDIALV